MYKKRSLFWSPSGLQRLCCPLQFTLRTGALQHLTPDIQKASTEFSPQIVHLSPIKKCVCVYVGLRVCVCVCGGFTSLCIILSWWRLVACVTYIFCFITFVVVEHRIVNLSLNMHSQLPTCSHFVKLWLFSRVCPHTYRIPTCCRFNKELKPGGSKSLSLSRLSQELLSRWQQAAQVLIAEKSRLILFAFVFFQFSILQFLQSVGQSAWEGLVFEYDCCF